MKTWFIDPKATAGYTIALDRKASIEALTFP